MKGKQKTPMEKLTKGYEKFMKDKEPNPVGEKLLWVSDLSNFPVAVSLPSQL